MRCFALLCFCFFLPFDTESLATQFCLFCFAQQSKATLHVKPWCYAFALLALLLYFFAGVACLIGTIRATRSSVREQLSHKGWFCSTTTTAKTSTVTTIPTTATTSTISTITTLLLLSQCEYIHSERPATQSPSTQRRALSTQLLIGESHCMCQLA